jgi:hypothetical protein
LSLFLSQFAVILLLLSVVRAFVASFVRIFLWYMPTPPFPPLFFVDSAYLRPLHVVDERDTDTLVRGVASAKWGMEPPSAVASSSSAVGGSGGKAYFFSSLADVGATPVLAFDQDDDAETGSGGKRGGITTNEKSSGGGGGGGSAGKRYAVGSLLVPLPKDTFKEVLSH